MKVELKKWTLDEKEALIKLCNTIDRRYLSDRLPDPYTEESAEWWLNMVREQDGNTGIFRKIVVNDRIIGTISVEQKEDVYRKDAEPNLASRTVLEKNGFLLEGVMKNAVIKNTNIFDLCIYGKIK